MLNKMSKVVCKSFWSRCFSVNPLLLTIYGFSLILICSILSTTGIAAEKGEIIFKSRIQRPDCTVTAPAEVMLDDIYYGFGTTVGFFRNPAIDILIECNNPINVPSFITLGTTATDRQGNRQYFHFKGINGDAKQLFFALEYPGNDKLTEAEPLNFIGGLNIEAPYVALIGSDGQSVRNKKYCSGDSDRKCQFIPFVFFQNVSSPVDPNDRGYFSLSVTFYLNYV